MEFVCLRADDPLYPQKLLQQGFADPLWVAGDASLLSAPSVAVIGSRQVTSHPDLERYVADRAAALAWVATKASLVDVSGLAYGCDIIGERAFVRAGGRCVSVLAAGLDQPVYPAANRSFLAESLRRGSCVVSQFAPGTRASRRNFVIRDRLQALLADSVFALTFGSHSGTRHTVDAALSFGKRIGVLNPDSLVATGADPEVFSGNVELLAAGQAVTDRIPRA